MAFKFFVELLAIKLKKAVGSSKYSLIYIKKNVRILQGGMEEWKAKGGFDAAAKATQPAKH